MSKLIIASDVKANLKNARVNGDKYARKSIWATIRTKFGIPASFKLGVAADGALYVKGTDPRQFLIANALGRYSHAAADQAQVQTAAVPAPAAVTNAADAGRWVVASVADAAKPAYASISLDDLLTALRDGAFPDVTEGVSLPDGMPAPGDGQVVIDTATSTLYFKQD